MRYSDSIADFFKSPKWGTNLLLGAVAVLIPFVGQLVLTGWHITLFWARGGGGKPADYPPFDFQNFGKYLERGLWPFLVAMAASLALIPVIMALVVPLFLLGLSNAQSGSGGTAGFSAALMIFMTLVYPVIMITFQLILVPLVLRATITQDFASAFKPAFVRQFLSLVWQELLVSALFMFAVGLALLVITVITCYVGGILLAPVAIFGWHHLQRQLYQLYLSRGGDPVPLSPKLHDLPPALPIDHGLAG